VLQFSVLIERKLLINKKIKIKYNVNFCKRKNLSFFYVPGEGIEPGQFASQASR
jgi:hypothetical protein